MIRKPTMRTVVVSGAVLAMSVLGPAAVRAEDAPTRTALRVCADPSSLPSSARDGSGYENKIAEMLGAEMGLPVEYTWFPQRIGFIRNTLRNNNNPEGEYKCDLVMGVPWNFELTATTRPYMHSTWALVYVKGRGLDEIESPEDLAKLSTEARENLRIGLFDRSPAAEWVARNGLMQYMRPYQMMTGDAREYPGRIIEEDLVKDRINLTFIWGPIAGYFANRIEDNEVVVIPMEPEEDIQFDYEISMGVRHSDKAFRDELNKIIAAKQPEIDAILAEYGVPMLPLTGKVTGAEDDDD